MRKVHCRIQNGQPPVPVLSQWNLFHAHVSCLRSVLILSLLFRSPGLLPSRFSVKFRRNASPYVFERREDLPTAVLIRCSGYWNAVCHRWQGCRGVCREVWWARNEKQIVCSRDLVCEAHCPNTFIWDAVTVAFNVILCPYSGSVMIAAIKRLFL